MAKKGSKYKIGGDVYQDAVDTRDDGGKSFINAFNWKLSGKDINKESFFKAEVGEKYKINILPCVASSENHPLVAKGKLKIGQTYYKLDVFIHKNVGPDNGSVICPKGTYGKPCPICDEYEVLKNAAENKKEEEAAAKLKMKHRSLYNVQVIEKGEPQPVQIMDESFFRFTKELLDEANAAKNGEEPLPFADPEDGSIVSFRVAKSELSKYDKIFKAFTFLDRDEEIEDDVIENECISLDECMVVYTAEELELIMHGQMDMVQQNTEDTDSDTEEEATEDTEDTEDTEEEETSKKSSDGECPYHMEFAEDFDTSKTCDECQSENPKCWKACAKANASI